MTSDALKNPLPSNYQISYGLLGRRLPSWFSFLPFSAHLLASRTTSFFFIFPFFQHFKATWRQPSAVLLPKYPNKAILLIVIVVDCSLLSFFPRLSTLTTIVQPGLLSLPDFRESVDQCIQILHSTALSTFPPTLRPPGTRLHPQVRNPVYSVPRWYAIASPGTRFVSLGYAIASPGTRFLSLGYAIASSRPPGTRFLSLGYAMLINRRVRNRVPGYAIFINRVRDCIIASPGYAIFITRVRDAYQSAGTRSRPPGT